MYACVKVCVPRKSLLSQKKVFRLKSTRKNTANYVAAPTSLFPQKPLCAFGIRFWTHVFPPTCSVVFVFTLVRYGTSVMFYVAEHSCQQLDPFA